MRTVQEIHEDLTRHLAKARRTLQDLLALTPDWTARCQLRVQFEELEEEVRDFAIYQLGITTTQRKA